MNHLLILRFSIVTILAAILSSCLGEGFEGYQTKGEPACEAATCTVNAVTDKTGLQAVNFEYSFSPTNAGSYYYITNQPSWMSIDKENHKIYGAPSSGGTFSDIKISIFNGTKTEVFGPFDIVVDGDPLANYAWHLQNTKQSTFASEGGALGIDLNIADVIARGYTGDGVRIAVSDTGVEIAHPDLTTNIIPGESRDYRQMVPLGKDPTPSDPEDGHGTAVAGIIGAEGWNSLGSRGIAPKAKLAGFYFIGAVPTLAEYIDQANGDFDIFNYSYGYRQCSYTPIDDTYYAQLKYGAENLRSGKGALYVKAAGNSFVGDLVDCGYPEGSFFYFGNANFDGENSTPYTILTAAINAGGSASSYTSPGANIWVSGTGGEFGTGLPAILTTDMTSCTMGLAKTGNTANFFEIANSLNPTCDYTSTMNGTSSAAPSVSGVIALMLEANPNLTWRDVKDILARTSTVYPPAVNTTHPAGENLTGHIYQHGWVKNSAGIYFHNLHGFGRINARAAVDKAIATVTSPMGVFVETVSPHTEAWYYKSADALALTIPDKSKVGVSSSLVVQHNLLVEAVRIKVKATHVFPADLGIELTSPSGTKSILLNINSNMIDFDLDAAFLSNAFYNESSRGTWTLKVIDGSTGFIGTLDNWSIDIFGHVDAARTDTTVPNPITGLTNTTPTLESLTITPTFSWTASNSGDVMRYEFSVGTTSGGADLAAWQSVGAALTASETANLVFSDGVTYYFNVRAIDQSENISTVVTESWVATAP